MRDLRTQGPLHVDGEAIVDGEGNRVMLRGVGLGGWMNMENFITGYPANERQMRAAGRCGARARPGRAFFDRLLTRFFAATTRAWLADLGVNCVRIPVNYRHFERDERPFEMAGGLPRLDAVDRACAASTASTA